jgi:hypothetical protein
MRPLQSTVPVDQEGDKRRRGEENPVAEREAESVESRADCERVRREPRIDEWNDPTNGTGRDGRDGWL